MTALRHYLFASLGIALLACSAEPEASETQSAAGDAAGQDDAGGKTDAPALSDYQCPGGLTACDGLCLNLAENEEHCGACNNVCGLDEICVAGGCQDDPQASGSPLPEGVCDPMEPAWECGPHSHCLPQHDGAPVCSGPAGHHGQYGACNGLDDCSPGFLCAETSMDAYCMQWCTSDLDCPQRDRGDRCVMLAEALFVGTQRYGVCYDGKP